MNSLPSEERFQAILGQLSQIKPILVVGDVGVDKYTYGEVARISPEAPVPIVEVTKEWFKLGLAANVTDNFHALKIPNDLCGVIGDDQNGSLFEQLLEEIEQKTWGVLRCPERPTTLKERVTTNTQQICRVDYESQQDLSEAQRQRLMARIEQMQGEYANVIIQDYNKGLVTRELVQELKKKNCPIYIDPSRGRDPLIYRGADLLKPNLIECRQLVENLGHRVPTLPEMAKILSHELEIPQLVITLGKEGMGVYQQGQDFTLIPTAATEVYDVSGAGDTVISVLAAALASGASLVEASWLGNCAAGVVVAKRGTATVNREELISFYRQLQIQKLPPNP